MREGGRLSPLKFTQLVSRPLLLLHGMIPLCGLHSRHGLLHSLQNLRQHDQHLLQRGWWWWWVALVVVVVDVTLPRVHHLKH
jgi:hypothetical protein